MDYQVGLAIKALRKERSLTIQSLANRSGLSKGYLSRVERGLKIPPVSTCSRIAQALGVQLSDLFTMEESSQDIVHVKPEQRKIISREGNSIGYYYEAMAHPFVHKLMEPFLLTFTPQPSSTHMFTHDGEEMIYVLQGRIRFLHGDQHFIAEEGDTLYFDATIPHRGECVGEKEAKVLIVMGSRNQFALS
ncbi:MAG TPA: XRE family transcriptional regulator [Desulfobacteraceae bacterium]|nr:XRE family transcriptional regulator [Desulfobacteraceae bacterium]